MLGRGKLIVTAATALALLLGGGIALVGSVQESAPSRDGDAPLSLARVRDDCDAPCVENGALERFGVPPGLRQLHFVAYAQLDEGSGPARIVVTDPSGDVRYDKVFVAGAEDAFAGQESLTWAAEIGTWTLSRTYAGLTGLVELEAWGERP